jgi:hypothetical protein
MALQFGTTLRNNMLDQIESTTGTAGKLRIWASTIRSNCGTADDATGTNKLAEIALPSDWMNAASGGTKTLLGSWTDAAADNTGTAVYFRLYDTAGTTCHMQGTVGTSASDLIVDSTSFTAGQTFNITTFTITAPGV